MDSQTQTRTEAHFEPYKKEGQVNTGGAVIGLVVTVGVAVLVLILVGALGGQTYQLVETDIDAITNTTIKNHIKVGITGGFEALEQTGEYLPLIVLAFVILIVLTLILSGFGGMTGGNMRGGSAL